MITRRLAGKPRALIVISLFLSSVPVLLFVNRFSDEPYMLFFGLWSMELGLQAMEGRPDRAVWPLMGACSALSVLAKPLMIPVVALNCLALLMNRRRLRRPWFSLAANALLYGAGAAIAGLPLVAKMPVRQFLYRMVIEAHNREGHDIASFVRTTHQAPFVVQNLVLLGLALAGVWLAFRRTSEKQTLTIVSCTLLLMMLMIARRPDWHYYFGFYWGLLFFAFVFTDALAQRIVRGRRELSPVWSFVMLMIVLNSWRYWGVLASYKQYHDRYERRQEIIRLHPYELPLIWEKSAGNADLSEVFGVYSRRLETTLQQLRARSSRLP